MSWPKTGAGSLSTGYLAQGSATTVRWGTDRVVKAVNGIDVYAWAVVERITQRPKVGNIHLPQGDGIEAGRVQLIHGQVWEVVLRDDTRMTGIPRIGTTVVVVDMAGHIGNVGLVYAATVIESPYEAQLGQAGQRHFTIENLLLVESQTGAAQP